MHALRLVAVVLVLCLVPARLAAPVTAQGASVGPPAGTPTSLSATPSWTAEGEQSGAAFGMAATAAGDVNGDGYGDLIVGASGYDGTFLNGGRALLYLGSASGLASTPAWVVDGGAGHRELRLHGATARPRVRSIRDGRRTGETAR